MNAHEVASELATTVTSAGLNEADTRHRIIDRILHEVLGWPHSSISCEEHVNEGYIDFVLRDKSSRCILVIEAKKQGEAFTLPDFTSKSSKDKALRFVRVKTLATDPSIKRVIDQVIKYCPSAGARYACVTNGITYIIFRPFIPGKSYLDGDAAVITDLSFFADNFTEARNLLAYTSVIQDHSLHNIFEGSSNRARDLHFPKQGIKHYDAVFSANNYARFLDPIARRYFGDISFDDYQMMSKCYVYASGSSEATQGISNRVLDSLSPFFQNDGGKDIDERRSGGVLTQRIAASLVGNKNEVLILYGGRGTGKSTFLRRLFYHEPPQDLAYHCFPIILDFLQSPPDPNKINRFVWENIVCILDQDKILLGDMERLVALFEDRFEVAKRQELSAYSQGSTDYILARNKLLMEWRNDLPYVAKCLRNYWEKCGRGLVVIFDNTDQLPPLLQDMSFLLAQNVSRELSCCTIISMREERYCRARTMGVLDAYHNSGFHLSAPNLQLVFTKRIKLVIRELEKGNSSSLSQILPPDSPFEDLRLFFITCTRQFRRSENALYYFLLQCSHHDMRRALEFFRQFLTSGYTHVEETISKPNWTVISHQVIKPMMIPDRYNYDENKSLIPNLFQCRDRSNGSHFSSVRILYKLQDKPLTDPSQGGYLRVESICDEAEDRFGTRGDYEASLNILLQYGLIEANNRLDCYKVEKTKDNSEETDHFIYADEVRITAFGIYMTNTLVRSFTYLDLISLDCGISRENLYHEMVRSAIGERTLGGTGQKMKRLEMRLQRTQKFVEYLEAEEFREQEEYQIPNNELLMPKIVEVFLSDLSRVRKSAKRNYGDPEFD